MRLIDADELKKNLRPFSYEMDEALGNTTYGDVWFSEERIIDLMPTIDPVMKCGEWLKHPGEAVSDDGLWGEVWYDCSVCGYSRHLPSKYCPNCGAQMVRERWKNETN